MRAGVGVVEEASVVDGRVTEVVGWGDGGDGAERVIRGDRGDWEERRDRGDWGDRGNCVGRGDRGGRAERGDPPVRPHRGERELGDRYELALRGLGENDLTLEAPVGRKLLLHEDHVEDGGLAACDLTTRGLVVFSGSSEPLFWSL